MKKALRSETPSVPGTVADIYNKWHVCPGSYNHGGGGGVDARGGGGGGLQEPF